VAWSARCGETFFRPSAAGEHLYVVLCDPSDVPTNPRQSVVFVGIFSLRHPWHERTLVLDVGDHRFIKHESYVDYASANVKRAVEIEKSVNDRRFRTHDAVASPLVGRIVAGALTSPRTPRYVKDFLRAI
jgi:hypothetical protein